MKREQSNRGFEGKDTEKLTLLYSSLSMLVLRQREAEGSAATATPLHHATTFTWNFYILKTGMMMAALDIIDAQVSAQSNQ
jgi:hypothetical protein